MALVPVHSRTISYKDFVPYNGDFKSYTERGVRNIRMIVDAVYTAAAQVAAEEAAKQNDCTLSNME